MEFERPIYEKIAKGFMDLIDSELIAAKNIVDLFPGEFERYYFELPLRVDRSRMRPKNDAYIYYDLEFSLFGHHRHPGVDDGKAIIHPAL